MATNGKGTGIVGYNGKKGRSAWRIRSASGRRGRGVEFAPDSLLEGSGFEPSVPRQTHYGSTLLSCPFCHDCRSAKGTHPSATGGPFRPLRKEAERRKCCRAGAVLVWNNRETEMANLVEIKALFLALVGGSPGAEGVFLNQNLAIRSTSVF